MSRVTGTLDEQFAVATAAGAVVALIGEKALETMSPIVYTKIAGFGAIKCGFALGSVTVGLPVVLPIALLLGSFGYLACKESQS